MCNFKKKIQLHMHYVYWSICVSVAMALGREWEARVGMRRTNLTSVSTAHTGLFLQNPRVLGRWGDARFRPLPPPSFNNPYSAILHLSSNSRYALSSLPGELSINLAGTKAGQRYGTSWVSVASVSHTLALPYSSETVRSVADVASMRIMLFHVSRLRFGRRPRGRGWLTGHELVLGRLYTSPGQSGLGGRSGLL